jgi:hypothetical protein
MPSLDKIDTHKNCTSKRAFKNMRQNFLDKISIYKKEELKIKHVGRRVHLP